MAAAVDDTIASTTTTLDSATPSASNSVNIGTRKSALAIVQTEIVIAELKKHHPHLDYRINAISTMGDKNQVTALPDFGAKSLWTFELEDMLEKGEVDFIVHSLKDIPTQMSHTLTLGAILNREDPRDALILHPSLPSSTTLLSLPSDSIIGTSSVRRSAQLARLYPHLRFQSVRGNVGTRLSKLDDPNGPYSAIILAAAGLLRLNHGHRISRFLSSQDPDELRRGRKGMLHAVGQGALGIQMREGDERIKEILKPLKSKKTELACLAERSLMRALEGGCSVPIGVETEWLDESDLASLATAVAKDGVVSADAGGIDEGAAGDVGASRDIEAAEEAQRKHLPWDPARLAAKSSTLTLRASVTSVDGKEAVESVLTKRVETEKEADEFGFEMANILVQRGAERILREINTDRKLVAEGDGA